MLAHIILNVNNVKTVTMEHYVSINDYKSVSMCLDFTASINISRIPQRPYEIIENKCVLWICDMIRNKEDIITQLWDFVIDLFYLDYKIIKKRYNVKQNQPENL